MNDSDEKKEKRWVAFGIGLHRVLVPKIRRFVEQEIRKEYQKLKTSHNIHTEINDWYKKYEATLNFENINRNYKSKTPDKKYDHSKFDYRVKSHIDFAKLFVENYMAKFNAFDECCDASTLFALLGKVPVFSLDVQKAAHNLNLFRNDWAHYKLIKWNQEGFRQSFEDMEKLVKSLALPSADKSDILRELQDWENKGVILCGNATVDPDLVKAVQQHVIALKNDVDTLAFDKKELRQQCQSAILNIITAVEELGKRVSSLELKQSEQRSRQEDLERRVTYLEGQSSTQICPDGNMDSSYEPSVHVEDLSGIDSDNRDGSETRDAAQQDSLESHKSELGSSDEGQSCSEDEGTDYADSDSSDIEDMLQPEEVELPQPSPMSTNQQRTREILTWIVYFVLVWQYKNYVSDNAIEQLLKFVQRLLFCIGGLIKDHTELCIVLATNIPTSLYSARKLLKIDRDNFQQYVVCPKCMKLYQMDEVVINEGHRTVARTCNNIPFPQGRRRKICEAQLANKVTLKNGKTKFYALKTYCYKSIIESLEALLKRPGLEEQCEKWRNRARDDDLYADVYDGKVWKKFGNWKGTKEFLNLSRSFGLMLNIDWFQPFKHRNDYSVGVMYMVLMNLPRNIRFKKENVILVGIIPALAHEPKSLNHFLEPAINELNTLWIGVKVNTCKSPSTSVEVRAALLCCAADIPAARKLCGFLGHSANRGCSHCYKFFPGGFGERKDYSGFDRDQWPRRTSQQHCQDVYRVRKCKSETEAEKLASKLGTRYTALSELPYYEDIQMCAIDPMHNLFLGTAKRVFSKWIESDIIGKAGLEDIQSRIEEFSTSSDIGRLPGNIKSNYGGYTAAQWKKFVLLYSMYALKDILPEQHLHYWQSFVLACHLLCNPCITKTDLMLADYKLIDFLKEYEKLNGKLAISLNMHLHLHLKECVENYGSIYGFWLFSFEQYNGMLGSYHTNYKTVEIQIMRKFMTSCSLANCLPEEYQEFVFDNCKAILGSKGVLENIAELPQLMMASTGSLIGKESLWADLSSIKFGSPYKLARLDQDELAALRLVYHSLYPTLAETPPAMATLYKKYSSLTVAGERYGSTLASRLCPYARVTASWCAENGCIDPGLLRPGIVRYYIVHSLEIQRKQYVHVFAVVNWLKPSEQDFGFKNPLSVWHARGYETSGPSVFLPVQRIHSKYLSAEKLLSGQKYLIMSPISRRILL